MPGLCPLPGLAGRQPRCLQSTHHGVSKGRLKNCGKVTNWWQSWEVIPGVLVALGSIGRGGEVSSPARHLGRGGRHSSQQGGSHPLLG